MSPEIRKIIFFLDGKITKKIKKYRKLESWKNIKWKKNQKGNEIMKRKKINISNKPIKIN